MLQPLDVDAYLPAEHQNLVDLTGQGSCFAVVDLTTVFNFVPIPEVPSGDIPAADQLSMAKRAHAHITEIDAPHLSMIPNPGVVTRVIIGAAQATG
jgi:hypothetical protein